MSSDIGKDKDVEEQPPMLISTEVSREALIDTAVKFLQNPKVKNSPLSQKKLFLESKGLTPKEIAIAFEKSGVSGEVVVRVPSLETSPLPYSHPIQLPVIISKWAQLRELLNTAVLICGAVYGLYHFSKKCILPYAFGLPSENEKITMIEKEMKEFQIATANSLLQLQNTLQALQVSAQQLNEKQDILITTQAIPKHIEAQFTDLRSEITSLKGLLLNRHQFPAAPSVSPIIPTWQMRNIMEANGRVSNDQEQTNFIEELNATDETENGIPSV